MIPVCLKIGAAGQLLEDQHQHLGEVKSRQMLSTLVSWQTDSATVARRWDLDGFRVTTIAPMTGSRQLFLEAQWELVGRCPSAELSPQSCVLVWMQKGDARRNLLQVSAGREFVCASVSLKLLSPNSSQPNSTEMRLLSTLRHPW